MKVMENDTDWQFVTIGDQVTPIILTSYVHICTRSLVNF